VFHHEVPCVRTLQKDLSKAGIVFIDDTGRRLDFHALRATFCTMLAVNHVPLAEAKSSDKSRAIAQNRIKSP